MATSGSKSVSVASGVTLKFNWSQTSQDVNNNKTTISWNMQLIIGAGSIVSSADKDWSVTVNGTKYSGTNTLGNIGANTTKTLASGSTTIAHNSDGTKTFSYSFSQEFAITYSGVYIGTKSGSGSGTLNTIPRASSISGGTGNIGSSVTISISRASNSFTHTLTYSFGSLSGTIATKTTSTSVSWTIPTSFYAQIPNAKSGTGTIKCETFNGSTSIGSKSISFTAKVTGSEPTLNPQAYVASDSVTASLTGSTTKFIKNFTTVTVSTGASAKNSATIKSQSVTCGGKSITSASGTIANVESDKFVFSVTDSRGYTTSQTLTRTLVNYVNPTIAWSSANISADGVATLGVEGVCFNGSFGTVTNTIKVQYQYKPEGGSWSSWKDFTITRNGNNYTATATESGFDYQKQYTFKAWIGDYFYDLGSNTGVYTAEKSVKSYPVFSWGASDFQFNVNVKSAGWIYTTSCIQAEDYIWAKGNLYTNGTFKFQHSPSQYARIGYATATDTDVACTYISNGVNNWLRLKDDGTIAWRGYDVLTSNGTQKITGGLKLGQFADTFYCTEYRRKVDSVGNILVKTGVSYVDTSYPCLAVELGTVAVSNGTETYTLKTRYRMASNSFTTATSNQVTIGTSGKPFTAVYASNGSIQTSDGRYKFILEDINSETCYELIKDMNLYGYSTLNKRVDEYNNTTEISDELKESSKEDMNLHMGFVAQEIEGNELSKYILIKDELVDDDGLSTGEHKFGVDNYAYTTAIHGALKYEIALRDKQIEELENRIEELEKSIRGE